MISFFFNLFKQKQKQWELYFYMTALEFTVRKLWVFQHIFMGISSTAHRQEVYISDMDNWSLVSCGGIAIIILFIEPTLKKNKT